MILLIGTGHIFDLTTKLQEIFDEKHPDLICVELDKQRYHALMIKKQQPQIAKESQKNLPFIYRLLARFQENMAQEYGVTAGNEMLTAINYAQTHQIPYEFIDMNAQQLFTKMWHTMPIREKLRLLLSGLGGLFVSKEKVEEEIQNYQEDFTTYLDEIGKKFPTIKKTLIDQRNEYMVNKLMKFMENHQQIIAIMGDGHIPGITQLLKEKDIECDTIRLNELQAKKEPQKDSTSAHFSINYKSTE